jgi:cytochrome c oxidase accessory protein FixG
MTQAAPRETVIKMYASREQIYPREAKGRYATLRWVCVWLTQLVFYGMPWLQWNGRQAVLFDIASRKFYIFGMVMWPQDFIYLSALLIICAFGLFLVTAVAGRIWCGFACPQTVYSEIFMWIERKIEGARSARIRLDRQPWTAAKIARKSAKHIAWGAVALWTGFSFVGYFTPIDQLMGEAARLSFGAWEWFWIGFYSLATYGNAGWLREQVCKYMCPYARFQSSMFDKDTLIVAYDSARSKDCIDCSVCVQVCPTGIDIRHGLQYECISCAACIDGCDMVMDKVGSPRGLIRYTAARAVGRIFRPRVLIYSALFWTIVAAFVFALSQRTPLRVDVIRDRGSMGREVDGMIENVYRLQVMNTAEQSHSFAVTVRGLAGIAIADPDEVKQDLAAFGGASTRAVPLRLRVPVGSALAGSHQIELRLRALDDPALDVTETAVFIVPR